MAEGSYWKEENLSKVVTPRSSIALGKSPTKPLGKWPCMSLHSSPLLGSPQASLPWLATILVGPRHHPRTPQPQFLISKMGTKIRGLLQGSDKEVL